MKHTDPLCAPGDDRKNTCCFVAVFRSRLCYYRLVCLQACQHGSPVYEEVVFVVVGSSPVAAGAPGSSPARQAANEVGRPCLLGDRDGWAGKAEEERGAGIHLVRGEGG